MLAQMPPGQSRPGPKGGYHAAVWWALCCHLVALLSDSPWSVALSKYNREGKATLRISPSSQGNPGICATVTDSQASQWPAACRSRPWFPYEAGRSGRAESGTDPQNRRLGAAPVCACLHSKTKLWKPALEPCLQAALPAKEGKRQDRGESLARRSDFRNVHSFFFNIFFLKTSDVEQSLQHVTGTPVHQHLAWPLASTMPCSPSGYPSAHLVFRRVSQETTRQRRPSPGTPVLTLRKTRALDNENSTRAHAVTGWWCPHTEDLPSNHKTQ